MLLLFFLFLSFLHTSKRDHLPKKLWVSLYFFPVIEKLKSIDLSKLLFSQCKHHCYLVVETYYPAFGVIGVFQGLY